MTHIHSYNTYSKGAKALRKLLHLQKIQHAENLPETILNWGACTKYFDSGSKVLNPYGFVNKASNKVKFFKDSETFRTPKVTFDLDEALSWVSDGLVVFGRLSRGHSGTDIKTFQDNPDGFVGSSFWSQYKKKAKEFRVHIMGRNNPEILKIQQKVLRQTAPDGSAIDPATVDFQIRTHRNGFIFKQNNLVTPDDVIKQAHLAFKASKLDFGAVDVIWNQFENKAYVLEINTAPGLSDSTAVAYAEGFKKHYGLGAQTTEG